MVTSTEFRDAMSRLSAAVNVVTTGGPHGPAGFTATAVCSVSDAPPTLLVCAYRGGRAAPVLLGNGVLCINVLAATQDRVADLFAGRHGLPAERRFDGPDWEMAANGAPVLKTAMVSFVCRVSEVKSIGTHDIIIATVEEVRRATEPATPLVYFDRLYGAVTQTASLHR